MEGKSLPGARAQNGSRTWLYCWLRDNAIHNCLAAALGLGSGLGLAAAAAWLGAAGGGTNTSDVSHLLGSYGQDHGKGPQH